MKQSFDEYASLYDAWFLENRNVLLSEARLVARTLSGSRNILSVGCGSGLFEKILREDFGINITEGIEPAAGMAEIARKRGMNVVAATATECSTQSFSTALRVISPALRRSSKRLTAVFPRVGVWC